LANAVGTAEALNLIAPPGTGKTTTLVQLAKTLVGAGEVVAGFVPLGEWSDRREDFFTFLTRRNAFGTFCAQHFMQLAYHGRFTLLLDGWNELDPAARVAANPPVEGAQTTISAARHRDRNEAASPADFRRGCRSRAAFRGPATRTGAGVAGTGR
jgi:DNA polymerase III delta prime subunit